MNPRLGVVAAVKTVIGDNVCRDDLWSLYLPVEIRQALRPEAKGQPIRDDELSMATIRLCCNRHPNIRRIFREGMA